MQKDSSALRHKRRFLKIMGGAVIASPFVALTSCGGGGFAEPTDDEDSDTDTSSEDTSSSSEFSAGDWAVGGTAAITTSFPPSDPFVSGLGNMCTTTRSYTLGPCYFNPDEYRQDISEGELGIPMVLVLKLVDANCQPITGADIDIWHCDRDGIYSGSSAGSSDASSFNSSFCTGNDSAALASRWFRGVQTTNSDGLVYFKSCFPGWYRGRTTHIHFKIVYQGTQSLVSQFCFEDAMSNEIYANHAEYTGEQKDTLNSRDSVFGSDYEDYMFTVEKNGDDSMLAYKAIQLA